MGAIYYAASQTPILIDDRVLAHLKVVIITKLRRNESFLLSFHHHGAESDGLSSVWLDSSIPLRFVLDTTDAAATLDAHVIQRLAASANTAGGIVVDDKILHASAPDAAASPSRTDTRQ